MASKEYERRNELARERGYRNYYDERKAKEQARDIARESAREAERLANERFALSYGFDSYYEYQQYHDYGNFLDKLNRIQNDMSGKVSYEELELAALAAHDIDRNDIEWMHDFLIFWNNEAQEQGLTYDEAIDTWQAIWNDTSVFDDWVEDHKEDDTKPYYHMKRK